MDGLQGPLIVRPGRGFETPVATPHDAEHVVFIADHYHALGAPALAALNRPFAGTPQARDPLNGAFTWVGNPQSVLINGRGNFSDCVPGNATVPATCVVAALGAAAGPDGCGHAVFDVRPGGEYLFRRAEGLVVWGWGLIGVAGPHMWLLRRASSPCAARAWPPPRAPNGEIFSPNRPLALAHPPPHPPPNPTQQAD
jgi:hypothetical protein